MQALDIANPTLDPPPAEDYDRVRAALEFISTEAKRQPQVEEIAAHVGLSPSHLHHLFQRWAGITPKAFLQAVTIDHARRLLRADAPLLDAALELGLSGPSRLHDLFNDFATSFNDADTVIVAPVYAAGEQPIEGVTHEELVTRIKARGHRDARVVDRPEAIAPLLASRVAEGDYVVMLGAGNITQWAAALPTELGKLMGKEPELP